METMGLNINSVEVNGYTKIANHGMIANNRTAALISMNGTVDWLCLPDFSVSILKFGICIYTNFS